MEVDAFRGAARLTIPLPVEAVRGGIGPELTFTYNVGGGNGPFGVGWSLAPPAVFRRTDKGVPLYDDERGSDILVAPGADEAVRVADDAGAPVVRLHALTGEQISSPPQGPYYEVWPYRARLENGFSRIEWWRRMAAQGARICAESFWRIVTRDNVTSLYGCSRSARCVDPDSAAAERIFQWCLERAFDSRGNAVEYVYAGDDDAKPIPPSASPRYLVRVRYANAAPFDRRGWLSPAPEAAPTWLCELAFDYGAAVGDAEGLLKDLIATVENPADKDRCAAPAQGPDRPDVFVSCRSGFAIRTRRLCRRILAYRHIAGEYDDLARSLELTYDENPYLSKLIAVTQVAWNGRRAKASPPLQFTYASEPDLSRAEIGELPAQALPGLRKGTERAGYFWIDLDAEGAPGALFPSAGGAWLYARNSGGGRFTAPEPVGYQPALAGVTGTLATTPAVRLLDLSGDGRLDAVEFARPLAGSRERAGDYSWDRFVPFGLAPVLDPDASDVRFVDLDGDGLADLLRSECGAYVWQRSLGARGFAPPQRLPWAEGDKAGPRLLFADRNETVYLADMSGDGLADFVRIRNGEVCYWPNLGHGRFGARFEMRVATEDGTGEAVTFDRSDAFSPARLRLLDLDGSGSTDLIYLGVGGARCWRNRSGNGFSPPVAVAFPSVDDPGAVSAVDLFANGCSCLVLAPGVPGGGSLRYLRLGTDLEAPDGGAPVKPHMLVAVNNNRGGETRFHYTSSAQFCVEDRDNGRPWITKLGFPVQVVARVERLDLVSGRMQVQTYRYRHGHYDGAEREFCGFAFVEQRDTVSFDLFAPLGAAALEGGAANADAALHLPASVIRTWRHTGAALRGEPLGRRLAREYFQAGTQADVAPEVLPDLDEAQSAEALRALRGAMLRQEIYRGDKKGFVGADERPYSVTAQSHAVRRLQTPGRAGRAAFHAHSVERIDYRYERHCDDPRVEHEVTLEIDGWGNVLQSAHIAYGRRRAGLLPDIRFLNDDERAIQSATSIVYSRRRYAPATLSALDHQAPALCESLDWEIAGFAPSAADGYFRPRELADLDGAPGLAETAYAAEAPRGRKTRRRVKHLRRHYWDAAGKQALPLGEAAVPLLAHQSFQLAFTPPMLAEMAAAAGEEIEPKAMNDAGYRRRRDLDPARFAGAPWPDDADAESWWAASPYEVYDAKLFFLPTRRYDAFGAEQHQSFGIGALLPVAQTDAVHNETRIANDYRLMQPRSLTDPNGCVTELSFDLAGMVAAVAKRGNVARPTGDRLDGVASDLDAAETTAFFRAPVTQAGPKSGARASLRQATTRHVYDAFAACNDLQPTRRDASLLLTPAARAAPVWAATISRQRHAIDGAPIEIAFAYADGFGEIAQTKQLTSPGEAHGGRPPNRWIGSGWRVRDNKNEVAREYEPFFSATHEFEPERRAGATHTTLRDPLGRVRARLTPHRVFLRSGAVSEMAPAGHSYEKRLYSAWGDETWDGADTVLLDPAADPDVADLFARLLEETFRPSWRDQRVRPELSGRAWPDERRRAFETEAARRAEVHAATPTRNFVDPRGRVFLTLAQHRRERDDPDEFLHTRVEFDVEGQRRALIDPAGVVAMRWDYTMAGLTWRTRSPDAGSRIALAAADGKPAIAWDASGRRVASSYDALRRLKSVRVREDGAEKERETYVYGEDVAHDTANLLRGRLYKQHDDSGATTFWRYDWCGQPEVTERDNALGGASLRRTDSFDAQGRLLRSQCGGGVVERKYSLSGALVAASATPGGEIVSDIEYLPSGQRRAVSYGGRSPGLAYAVDPLTGRLHYQEAGALQKLAYVYDPVGNIAVVCDEAVETVYFDGQRVEPVRRFRYDSLYRLIGAEGREHCSRSSASFDEAFEAGGPFDLCVHPADRHGFRNYAEIYHYDAAGNLQRQRHVAARGSWTRRFETEAASNRLRRVTVGDNAESFEYEENGAMSRLPHLSQLDWDYRDRLIRAERGDFASRFTYDASGRRAVKSEPRGTRSYLGEFEVFSTGANTVAIRDGESLLALVDHGGGVQARLQICDWLGSCALEVDAATGEIVAREEYYPYGGTSYQERISGAAARRYRFTAKERDEFTGLSFHGARYYAPWLGRWISADPGGVGDGANVYLYAHGNPLRLVDRDGTTASEPSSLWDRTKENAGVVEGWLSDKWMKSGPSASAAISARDAWLRKPYEKAIKAFSNDAVAEIEQAGANGDFVKAELSSLKASWARNLLREVTQESLSPHGEFMSRTIDRELTPSGIFNKYAEGGEATYETFKIIVQKSGTSNAFVSGVGKFVRGAGPAIAAAGIVKSGYLVWSAEEGQGARVAAGELGANAGGAVGYSVGSAVGTGAVAGGAMAYCAYIGVAVAPPAWAVVGAAVPLGLVGGYFGATVGREEAVATFDFFKNLPGFLEMGVYNLYGVPH